MDSAARNLVTRKLLSRAVELSGKQSSQHHPSVDVDSIEIILRDRLPQLQNKILTQPGDDTCAVINSLFAESAFQTLLPLGLQTVQSWNYSNSQLSIHRPDGMRTHLSSSVVNYLLALDAKECVIRSNHELWVDVERSMRSYYHFFEKEFEGEDKLLHKRWTSISIIKIASSSNVYFLLAADVHSPSADSTAFRTVVHPNNSKIKSLLTLQATRAIADSILSRLQNAENEETREYLLLQRQLHTTMRTMHACLLGCSVALTSINDSDSIAQLIANKALLVELGVQKSWVVMQKSNMLVSSTGHKSSVRAVSTGKLANLKSAILDSAALSNSPTISTMSFSELISVGLCTSDESAGSNYSQSFTIITISSLEPTYPHKGNSVSAIILAVPNTLLDQDRNKENHPHLEHRQSIVIDKEPVLVTLVEFVGMLKSLSFAAFQRVENQAREQWAGELRGAISSLWSKVSYLENMGDAGTEKGGEVLALCREIRSPDFSKACRADNCFVLLSNDAWSSELRPPNGQGLDLFHLELDSSANAPLNDQPLFENERLWLHDLVNGSHVSVGCGTDSSCRDIILKLDRDFKSALLIPLRTVQGLCILAVCCDHCNDASSPLDQIQTLLLPSVRNDLSAVVDLAFRLTAARIIRRQSDRASRKLASLGALLQCWSRRTACLSAFHHWACASRTMKQNEKLRIDSGLLDAALVLSNSTSAPRLKGGAGASFLRAVEMMAAKLFPSDSVLSSHSVLAAKQDETARRLSSIKSSIVGHIVASSSSTRTTPVHVGSIAVERSAGCRPFTAQEIDTLTSFCRIASTAYVSFRSGYSILVPNDTPTADNSGQLLPFLSETLPLLLETLMKQNASKELQGVLPHVVRWAKRITSADMALLRLQFPLRDDEGPSEALITSEDIVAECSSSAFNSSNLAAESLVILQNTVASTLKHTDEGMTPPDMVLRLRIPDEGKESWGELKLLKNAAEESHLDESFLPEHHSAVEIIGFVIAQTMKVADKLRILEKDAQRSRELSESLETLLGNTSRSLQAEKALASSLTARLSSLSDLIYASLALPPCTSAAQVAAWLDSTLTQLLGVDNVLLLVRPNAKNGVLGDSNGLSVVFASDNTERNHKSLTFEQLQELPVFVKNDISSIPTQSVLLFTNGVDNLPFCGLLIFASERSKVVDWSPLATALTGSLGSLLVNAFDRIELYCDISALTDADRRAVSAEKDNERLIGSISTLQATVRDLDKLAVTLSDELVQQRENYHHQSSIMESEMKQAAVDRDFQEARLKDQILVLEVDSNDVRTLLSSTVKHKAALMSLIAHFSSDPSHNNESIISWLAKYCDTRECNLLLVGQTENGNLTGGGGVRGLLAAASEVMRTRVATELFTYISDQKGNGRSEREKGSIVVFCVPNRCVGPKQSSNCAAFVFHRPARSQADTFTDGDKELLLCAANLVSRVISRASPRYNSEEFRQLDIKSERSMAIKLKYQEIASICEYSWKQQCKSRGEVVHLIEAGAKQLLTRQGQECCHISCHLWILPWTPASATGAAIRAGDLSMVYTTLSAMGFGSEAGAVQTMLASKKTCRKAGILWVAIKGADEEVIAALRVERKLFTELNADDLPGGLNEHQDSVLSLADIVINDEEAEVVEVLCRLLYPTIEHVSFVEATSLGLENASSAINALQAAKCASDQAYLSETASRHQVQQALHLGMELLAIARSRSVPPSMHVSCAKNAIMSMTASQECFVILPFGPDLQEHASAAASDDHSPLNRVRDCYQESDSSALHASTFYLLETDSAYPTRVIFEANDLEITAIRSTKPRASPQDDGNLWCSWGWRKFHNNAQKSGATPSHSASSEKGESRILHTLAVPFAMRDGTHGVISVVRYAGFSSVECECLSWIGRVLAFSLNAHSAPLGDADFQESQHRLLLLQKEVEKLRACGRRLSVLDLDQQNLEHDLHRANAVFPIVMHVNHAVSGNTSSSAGELRVLPSNRAAAEQQCHREIVLSAARQVFSSVILSSQQPDPVSEEDKLSPGSESLHIDEHRGLVVISSETSMVVSSTGTAEYRLETLRKSDEEGAAIGVETTHLVLTVQHKGLCCASRLSVAFGTQTVGLVRIRIAFLLRLLDYQQEVMAGMDIKLTELRRRQALMELSRAAFKAGAVLQTQLSKKKRLLVSEADDGSLEMEWLEAALVEVFDGFAKQSSCHVTLSLMRSARGDPGVSGGEILLFWSSGREAKSNTAQKTVVEGVIKSRSLKLVVTAKPFSSCEELSQELHATLRMLLAQLTDSMAHNDVLLTAIQRAQRAVMSSLLRHATYSSTAKKLVFSSIMVHTLRSQLETVRCVLKARELDTQRSLASLSSTQQELQGLQQQHATTLGELQFARLCFALPCTGGAIDILRDAGQAFVTRLHSYGCITGMCSFSYMAPTGEALQLMLDGFAPSFDDGFLLTEPILEKLGSACWLQRRILSLLQDPQSSNAVRKIYMYKRTPIAGDVCDVVRQEEWLVPMRNGESVAAVLRLSVFHTQQDAAAVQFLKKAMLEPYSSCIELSTCSEDVLALQAMIASFSDALAPTAAAVLHASKIEHTSLANEAAVKAVYQIERRENHELLSIRKAKTMLHAALGVCGEFMERDLVSLSSLTPAQALSHLTAPLGEVFGGICTIHYDAGDVESECDGLVLTQLLEAQSEKPAPDGAANALRVNFTSSSGFVSLKDHIQVVASILPAVVKVLVGIIGSLQREFCARECAIESKAGCAALCDELDKTISRAMTLADLHHTGAQTTQRYQKLSQLLGHCVRFAAHLEPSDAGIMNEQQVDLYTGPYGLLQRVCDKIPGLFELRSMVYVAIDPASIDSTRSGSTPEGSDLLWFQSFNETQELMDSSQGVAYFYNPSTGVSSWTDDGNILSLSVAQQEMVQNIGRLSCTKKSSSTVEISGLAVVSLPILHQHTGESLGVLQCIQDDAVSTQSDGGLMLQEISAALSAALTEHASSHLAQSQVAEFESRIASMGELWARLSDESKNSAKYEAGMQNALQILPCFFEGLAENRALDGLLHDEEIASCLVAINGQVVEANGGLIVKQLNLDGDECPQDYARDVIGAVDRSLRAASSIERRCNALNISESNTFREALSLIGALLNPCSLQLALLATHVAGDVLSETELYGKMLHAMTAVLKAVFGESLSYVDASFLVIGGDLTSATRSETSAAGVIKSFVTVRAFRTAAGDTDENPAANICDVKIPLTGNGNSVLERCLLSGGTQINAQMCPSDCLGLHDPSSPPKDCAAVATSLTGIASACILRVIFRLNDPDRHQGSNLTDGLLYPVIDTLARIFALALDKQAQCRVKATAATSIKAERDKTSALLVRQRKLGQAISRDALSLMQIVPLQGPHDSAAIKASHHPILLPPLAALEITINKLLALCGKFCSNNGSAVVLCDRSAEDEDGRSAHTGFQVVFTGQHLHYPQQEALPNTLWTMSTVISSERPTNGSSLVEIVLSSRKPLLVATPLLDERYNRTIDGICAPHSSLLLVPILSLGDEGLGLSCIGVLVLTRLSPASGTATTEPSSASSKSAFTSEDLSCLELLVSISAHSLFWIDGMVKQWSDANRSMESQAKMDEQEELVGNAGRNLAKGAEKNIRARKPSVAPNPKREFSL